jgi:hypothetical protein
MMAKTAPTGITSLLFLDPSVVTKRSQVSSRPPNHKVSERR